AHGVEIAGAHAFFGEPLVESHHQRLILRTNRTQCRGASIPQRDLRNILRRIWANRTARHLFNRRGRIVEDYPRIQTDQTIGRRKQWIDIDLLDPWLIDHELAETDKNLL